MFAFLSEVNYICNATRDFLLFAFAIHFVLVWAAMLDFSGFFEPGLGSRKGLEYRYRYSSMILVYTIDYRGRRFSILPHKLCTIDTNSDLGTCQGICCRWSDHLPVPNTVFECFTESQCAQVLMSLD